MFIIVPERMSGDLTAEHLSTDALGAHQYYSKTETEGDEGVEVEGGTGRERDR